MDDDTWGIGDFVNVAGSPYNFIVIGFYRTLADENRVMLSSRRRQWKSVTPSEVDKAEFTANFQLAAVLRIEHYKRAGYVKLNPIPGWTDVGN